MKNTYGKYLNQNKKSYNNYIIFSPPKNGSLGKSNINNKKQNNSSNMPKKTKNNIIKDNIAINNTIQTFTASRKTISAKTDGSDFGIALQSAFSYSEARGVNAITSNALEMLDDELEDMYVMSNSHKIQIFQIQIQR